MLEKQLSMGLKIALIIAAIILIHGVSNIAGNLGLISDLFILLGLIQSVRFISDKQVREETVNSFSNFINTKDVHLFIDKIISFIKEDRIKISDVGELTHENLADVLDNSSLDYTNLM